MANKTDREAAIRNIMNIWIEMDDPQIMGHLIYKGSFAQLYTDVTTLRNLGSTVTWKAGVTRWLDFIVFMHKTFCDNSGFSYIDGAHWTTDDGAYSGETRKEFVSLLKHSIMQGSTYVWVSI